MLSSRTITTICSNRLLISCRMYTSWLHTRSKISKISTECAKIFKVKHKSLTLPSIISSSYKERSISSKCLKGVNWFHQPLLKPELPMLPTKDRPSTEKTRFWETRPTTCLRFWCRSSSTMCLRKFAKISKRTSTSRSCSNTYPLSWSPWKTKTTTMISCSCSQFRKIRLKRSKKRSRQIIWLSLMTSS